jgi:hypothetical protein
MLMLVLMSRFYAQPPPACAGAVREEQFGPPAFTKNLERFLLKQAE